MVHVNKLIGKNIKLARVKKDWSQADLAHRLDVEQSYISRVESGLVAASCERIYEIIHLLDCESTDIFPPAKPTKTSFNG
ncbi:helix-turn-helix domain-containing protein [Pseudoalteromonas sp. NGC95]|uniref:helix-turn-helix domain-containing protein n=1 Tax=Pseudoalteromonas sp. NGC95 TaxID=2792051 RepID=UPI0018CCC6D2|nr:helix-turn-helix transcriptional regulator [Pseudoalteromonas sp. NGC95]MBH0015165.1 helix-turn-helix transcriptional regulator [Pseudoalteromonas sp. NGC95]